jgi:multidrug efflux pump subunit AcrA (membrane-fusion protein)
MILDESDLKSSAAFWLFSSAGSGLYRIVIILFVCILFSMFLIHVDISVVARGVIRPVTERSEIRSPAGRITESIIGECYVTSKDIGLIKIDQPVKFQVDAYNYNYFGTGTGRIYFIDDDYFLSEKTPVYRVRFQMNERKLKLPNGFSGELKKGMGFQARFKVCSRTLWQLLYEKVDDWVNPFHQST